MISAQMVGQRGIFRAPATCHCSILSSFKINLALTEQNMDRAVGEVIDHWCKICADYQAFYMTYRKRHAQFNVAIAEWDRRRVIYPSNFRWSMQLKF